MCELDAFAIAGKDDRMLTDDIAAAQGGKSDGPASAAADLSVAHTLGHRIQGGSAPCGGGLAKSERRAGGRIHLVAVVHLHDFDIVVLSEDRGDLPCQPEEKVDADAHVGADDHRNGFSGGGQALALLTFQSRRPDDEGGPMASRQAGVQSGCRGRREVDNGIGALEQGVRIGLDAATGIRATGQRGNIATDELMAGPFRAAGKTYAVRVENRLHEHAPHAAATSDNANFHAGIHQQSARPRAQQRRLISQILPQLLDLGKEAMRLRAVPVFGPSGFKLFKQLFLLLGEVDRRLDNRLDEHIAADG